MDNTQFQEKYQRIGEDDETFDIQFWQSQGDRAIFEAATGMVKDYLLLRGENADELRLHRSVESFRKIPFLSREDLIRSKKASGREQDEIDIKHLRRKTN